MKLGIIFLLLLSQFSLNSQNRGIKSLAQHLDQNIWIGKQYLLLIAINDYQGWMPLKNPVVDAKEIKDILTKHYYIDEVIEIFDHKATKSNIIHGFGELQNVLKTEDSLLIYYAGHGHFDDLTNSGFWIPVNGKTDPLEQFQWLPHSQIIGLLSKIKANHICLISDSCFAGDILRTRGRIADLKTIPYFRNAYKLRSRQILTSSSSTITSDNSEFSLQLKLALKKNTEPFLDTLMLYNQIKLGVSQTTPLMGALKSLGHQDGASFLLFKKESKKLLQQQKISSIINQDEKILTKTLSFQRPLALKVSPGVIFPIFDSYKKYRIGSAIEMSTHIKIFPALYLDFHLAYHYLPINSLESHSLSIIGAGAGMGSALNILPKLNINIFAKGGYFYTFANTENVYDSNPYCSLNTAINYGILKNLSLGIEGAYKKYFYLCDLAFLSLKLKYSF